MIKCPVMKVDFVDQNPGHLRCPVCGSELKKDTIVRLKDSGDVQVIGRYQFCINMRCDFETN